MCSERGEGREEGGYEVNGVGFEGLRAGGEEG
jgi:hypothetical protein